MNRLTRRQLFSTMAGAGAALMLGESELFAQNRLEFRPLQLNAAGRRLLNPQVTALDQHEDELLDDLLAGNQNGEIRDLQNLDGDFNGLLRGNGIPNQHLGQYGGEIRQIRGNINLVLRRRVFRRDTIFGCVKLVDFFVGHWYPCNDLLEISTCQAKIWKCCHGRPNYQAIDFYIEHMQYELTSLFNFHPCGGPFQQHSAQLLVVLDQAQRCAFRQDIRGCRNEFMRFSMATDILCRKYYPQWC